ncbi:MAG: bifunctional oligoribonuclease/PAP phosphatase NrnA [Eubacteriales bacterium]|nr:bifunctional oligoribonuclease/PAP phosphatase NrnA [Eubacteriales bacterium]MDD4389807.1 bifunctional oligoribonuclease/PAP phosphatase NrnA [Eubacteriales bacterium]
MQSKLNAINEKLIKSERVLIFSHIMPDGDALGSSLALCRALRLCGKDAYIVLEEEIVDNLKFLDNDGYCLYTDGTESPEAFFSGIFGKKTPDISIMLDCSEYSRIEKRIDIFKAAPCKICVDHHCSAQYVADINWVEPERAATGEMVYILIRDLEAKIGAQLMDMGVCQAIYAAIVTDTGKFQYSNTTGETHKIVMEMMNKGFDHSNVSVQIFQSKTLGSLRVKGAIIGNMKIFAEGKASISYITQEMLREAGAKLYDTEGAVEELRNIKGIEIATFLKQLPDGRIKGSMRAKSDANVMEIAASFGGGGHIKAAGFTFTDTDMDEACQKLCDAITKALSEECI